MRQIVHPGPLAEQRAAVVSGSAVPLDFLLSPGLDVNTAIRQGFAEAGCKGGFVRMNGGSLRPFNYVIPAVSPDAEHAAWFSETLTLPGSTTMEDGGATVGLRDGQPFLHCHGLWAGSDGERRMGHMLPLESWVIEPVRAVGIGFRDALFDAAQDTETNFRLFEPSGEPATSGESGPGKAALLVRLRPNQDISLAVEAICAAHGIAEASVHGIGSLVGVQFTDGRSVSSYATEVLITEGVVSHTPAGPSARIDIAVVDIHGAIFEGSLVRGENSVCVTFELVIEPLG